MKRRNNVYAALLAALLCVLSPWAVPVGAVPLSLGTLGVYMAAGMGGPLYGGVAVGVYLLLGAVGVPVFAGFMGGFAHLAGPTGGYLWGYLLCAVVAGLLCRACPRRGLLPLWLGIGTLVLYAVGTAWYLWQMGGTLWGAVTVCVLPFFVGDCVKIAVATGLLWSLRRHMGKGWFLPDTQEG